jgi:hypothetical protein
VGCYIPLPLILLPTLSIPIQHCQPIRSCYTKARNRSNHRFITQCSCLLSGHNIHATPSLLGLRAESLVFQIVAARTSLLAAIIMGKAWTAGTGSGFDSKHITSLVLGDLCRQLDTVQFRYESYIDEHTAFSFAAGRAETARAKPAMTARRFLASILSFKSRLIENGFGFWTIYKGRSKSQFAFGFDFAVDF